MQDRKDFNSTNGSKGKPQELIQKKNPGSALVGFSVDKVARGQVSSPSPLVLRFSPVNFIPPVLHYSKKLIIFVFIFITGLHNKT
jgi:hypothetical protein